MSDQVLYVGANLADATIVNAGEPAIPTPWWHRLLRRRAQPGLIFLNAELRGVTILEHPAAWPRARLSVSPRTGWFTGPVAFLNTWTDEPTPRFVENLTVARPPLPVLYGPDTIGYIEQVSWTPDPDRGRHELHVVGWINPARAQRTA